MLEHQADVSAPGTGEPPLQTKAAGEAQPRTHCQVSAAVSAR